MSEDRPEVLFLCIHNAGRSQMALGWFKHLAGDRALGLSGGSEPADQINRIAIQAMAEVGIDITEEYPKPWTEEVLRAADVVVTMGCGDVCPYYPGKRYEQRSVVIVMITRLIENSREKATRYWPLDDPAGLGLEAVRPIRDEIRRRVQTLLGTLAVSPPAD